MLPNVWMYDSGPKPLSVGRRPRWVKAVPIHAHVTGYKVFLKSHRSPACQPCLFVWPQQSPSWTLHRFRGRGPGPAKAYHGQPPRPHGPTGLARRQIPKLASWTRRYAPVNPSQLAARAGFMAAGDGVA